MDVVENILGEKYEGYELGGKFGELLSKVADKYGLKGVKRESFILDLRAGLTEGQALENIKYV